MKSGIRDFSVEIPYIRNTARNFIQISCLFYSKNVTNSYKQFCELFENNNKNKTTSMETLTVN